MNKKGLTLVELMAVIGIILIIGFVVFGQYKDAGGMELLTLTPASDTAVERVTKILKQDPHQTVIILTYAADWVMDTVDPLLDKSKKVFRDLIKAGISAQQINWTFANKGGLVEDSLPTPTADGVYLYLE